MRPIVTFASGNLAAATMRLVNKAILQRGWPLHAFTDGLLLDADDEPRAFRTVDVGEAHTALRDASLFVTSIRSPGGEERRLIRAAQELGVPSLLLVADLGSGPQKLREDGNLVMPDVIAVADEVTWRIFIDAGIPSANLRKVGSPYLDSLCRQRNRKGEGSSEVCYFDVPSDHDFAMWGCAAPFSEAFARDCFGRAVHAMGSATGVIRMHPKQRDPSVYRSLVGRALWIEGHGPGRLCLEERIARSEVIVSTYSTGLLVAGELGKQAISFQPGSGEVVRERLYRALGIPLARSERELAALLSEASGPDTQALPARTTRFHRGRALPALLVLMQQMMSCQAFGVTHNVRRQRIARCTGTCRHPFTSEYAHIMSTKEALL